MSGVKKAYLCVGLASLGFVLGLVWWLWVGNRQPSGVQTARQSHQLTGLAPARDDAAAESQETVELPTPPETAPTTPAKPRLPAAAARPLPKPIETPVRPARFELRGKEAPAAAAPAAAAPAAAAPAAAAVPPPTTPILVGQREAIAPPPALTGRPALAPTRAPAPVTQVAPPPPLTARPPVATGLTPAPVKQIAPPPPLNKPGVNSVAQAAPGTAKEPSLPRPLESPLPPPSPETTVTEPLYQTPMDPPNGFTGPSGILPRDVQQDNHFVPVEDRWRMGFPQWDRYDKGHPFNNDYPYLPGNWWDPYNQNVLKGDFPIIGQNTFLEITGSTQAFFEPRQTPIATTPFESTSNPHEENFFGKPNQFFYLENFFLSLDLFHADGAFRPVDWRVKVTPVFDINYLAVEELGVVSPNLTAGTTRARTFTTLNEWFVESKLLDLGPNYDFISVRAGAQPFTSDFRGFIFSDLNRAIRLFGTNFDNRHQFNLVYFQQLEKDTNSTLNTFKDRHQGVLIANYYIQDFLIPGYTTELSAHYNHDSNTFRFDNNGFLVRPEPIGSFTPHNLDVAYIGWAGDGHINHFNVNHAFYEALGYDTHNPFSNTPQDINAQMAAFELSYDQDWVRFRTSFFWASGDHNINNRHATGFDSIIDNPNFAGGDFSYWQRQQVGLLNTNLTQRMSLLPSLRSFSQSSKFQAQANFVNPGLYLGNFGVDFDLTPKLRIIQNTNFLWFDAVQPLQQLVFQKNIRHTIGTDISLGTEYRPFLNNNMLFRAGIALLIPGNGFRDLYANFGGGPGTLVASFLEAVLTF